MSKDTPSFRDLDQGHQQKNEPLQNALRERLDGIQVHSSSELLRIMESETRLARYGRPVPDTVEFIQSLDESYLAKFAACMGRLIAAQHQGKCVAAAQAEAMQIRHALSFIAEATPQAVDQLRGVMQSTTSGAEPTPPGRHPRGSGAKQR
jgi:hypothetical protein